MPLTAKQLDTFRQTLSSQRAQLQNAISDDLKQTGEQHHLDLADQVMDAGDQAVAERLANLDIAFLRHHVHELGAVEDAQRRLLEGRYGVCIDCSSEIELRRLEVNPVALRCLECQAIAEKRVPMK